MAPIVMTRCNHIRVSIINGLDTEADPRPSMIWSRLDRSAADDAQREFHPGSDMHRSSLIFG